MATHARVGPTEIAAPPRSGTAGSRRPQRVQRPRKRPPGYRTPEGVAYVGRGSIWVNPFRFDRFGHVRSVRLHQLWLTGELTPRMLNRLGFGQHETMALYRLRKKVLTRLDRLRGLDLQCWCPARSRWCHADTLIALANHEPS